MDKHGITILYHIHQCRPCTSHAEVGNGGIIADVPLNMLNIKLELSENITIAPLQRFSCSIKAKL